MSQAGAAGDRLLEVLIDLGGGMHRRQLGLTAPDSRAETLVGTQVAVGDGRGVFERRFDGVSGAAEHLRCDDECHVFFPVLAVM